MRNRDQRFLCDFCVEILLTDQRREAVIVDVALGGAGLEGIRGMRVGQGCTLLIDGRTMPATVCWVSGDTFGVKFQRRLLPQEFDLISGVDAYAQVMGRRQSRGLFGSRAA